MLSLKSPSFYTDICLCITNVSHMRLRFECVGRVVIVYSVPPPPLSVITSPLAPPHTITLIHSIHNTIMSEGPEASGSSQSMEGALPAHTPKEPLAVPADAVAVPPVPLNTQSPLPTSPDSTLDIPPERGAEVLPEATMDVDALPEASISVLPEASMGVVPEASMDVVPEASMDVIPEASMDVLPEASVDIPPVGDVDTVPEGSGDIPLEGSANIALEGSANIAPADPTSTATPGPTSPANPVPTVTTAPVSPSTARRASSLAEGDEVYPIPDSIHPIPEGDDAILTMDQIRWLGRFRPFPEPVRCSLTINNVACNAYMETADKLDRVSSHTAGAADGSTCPLSTFPSSAR